MFMSEVAHDAARLLLQAAATLEYALQLDVDELKDTLAKLQAQVRV